MDQDYIKTLSFPKWKRKRQQIFKRDHYRCTCCGNNHNLIVHHTYYFGDFRNPWEYPDKSLLTLCKDCHKQYHEFHENEIRKAKKIIRVVFHNKKAKKQKKTNRLLEYSRFGYDPKTIRRLRTRERAIGLTS